MWFGVGGVGECELKYQNRPKQGIAKIPSCLPCLSSARTGSIVRVASANCVIGEYKNTNDMIKTYSSKSIFSHYTSPD